MRLAPLAVLVSIVAAGCGRNDAPVVGSGFAPPDAPERASLPIKCKSARTFDTACRELFDKTWGSGAGGNELANLNKQNAYADGNAFKKSTAKPAPTLGGKQ